MVNQIFSVELKGVKEALEAFDPKIVKKAIRSTLDKTGTYGKKEIVETISSEYNIAPKDIRDKISVVRTTMESLETKLRIVSRKLSLVYFKARQAPKGVLANIRKSSLEFYKSAFVQTMPTGFQGVFKRKTTKRYPIKHLAGPSVTEIVGSERIWTKITATVQDFMDRTFKDEIDKRINE
jgi:hypothetical protein